MKPYVNFEHYERSKKVQAAMDELAERLFPVTKKREKEGEFYSLLSWEENEQLIIKEFDLRGKYKALFLGHSQRWAGRSLI